MSKSCVYLEKVEDSLVNIAISGLAEALNIPDNTAQKIVNSAPIILFSNLEAKQADAIVRAFSLIVEKGVGIASALTSTRSEKPITWPKDIKVRGRSLEDYAFASLDGGFLAGGFCCPRCGEKFAIISNPVTNNSSPVEISEAPVVQETVEKTAQEPAEKIVKEPVTEVVEEPTEELVEESVEEVIEAPVAIAEEVVEEIIEEPQEEIALENDDEIVEEVVEVVDEVSNTDDIGTVEAPAPLGNESTFETISPGSGEFSVRLKGIKGKDAKAEASAAIQEIMGLSEADAKKILKKVIINAVKDISEEEANNLAAKFEAKGIKAEVKAKK